MNYTDISITPWGAATFADTTFILVTVTPKTGLESFFDYKDFTVDKNDLSEVRRNREDDKCIIYLKSGLSHEIEFQPNDPINPIKVFVGGIEATSNENLRDLLMSIVEQKYI